MIKVNEVSEILMRNGKNVHKVDIADIEHLRFDKPMFNINFVLNLRKNKFIRVSEREKERERERERIKVT
jgi:hypothetical protein